MYLIPLIGRLLFGGFFVLQGMNHFTKHGMVTQYAMSKGVPMAGALVMISGALIVIGGLGVIFGAYMRLSAFLIALFLVPVTLQMHAFWKIKDPAARSGEMVNFLKNTALLGASLMMF